MHATLRATSTRAALSRSACALRGSPAPAGALRRSRPTRPTPRRGLVTQAVLLPTAIKIAADCAGAFVLLYCSLNWASLRRVRKEVEKIEEGRGSKDSERKARIQKLTGQDGAGKPGDKPQ